MDGRVENGLVCLDFPVPDEMNANDARRVAATLLRLASMADPDPLVAEARTALAPWGRLIREQAATLLDMWVSGAGLSAQQRDEILSQYQRGGD